jgi:nucleotide-binding universal stress UspA family protein
MKILLAIDGSEVSDAAVRAINERPWPAGSVVRVLHVVPPLYPPAAAPWAFSVTTPSGDTGLREVEQRVFESAREMVKKVAASLAPEGREVEVETVLGDPRDAIVAQARDWGADLIVLGSHGRTGVKRWMLGSVAEAVVRHAPCSVEVARSRAV